MYELLALENFKGFRELELDLRPLTLLSGLNGVGKSSVIQSLLLLRQSFLQWNTAENLGLVLNGDLVELGTGQDVFFNRIHYVADTHNLRFALTDSDIGQYRWEYEYDYRSDVLMPSPDSPNSKSPIYETNLFSENSFHYLQAERVGPRAAFGMADHLVRQRRQLGKAGQYAAHFLQIFGQEPILETLAHESSRSLTLASQVTAWMGEISPGTKIDIQPHADMDLISLRFGFEGTDTFRSTNVGFGITYTLPILVALLSAPVGSLVLLENPEAHLHPKGQSRIGELISRVAAAGVQVIVETHSDHILNGIRIATKKGLVEPEAVALHFLQRPQAEGETDIEILSPELDREGKLDFWPKDFFDEWKVSLDKLLYGGGQ